MSMTREAWNTLMRKLKRDLGRLILNEPDPLVAIHLEAARLELEEASHLATWRPR